MFSLRIVTTSHYQAAPIPGLDNTYSEFRDAVVKRVPVLRIFGATPKGQKACMHIHGVFPYLYVPYDGTQPTDRYVKQFAVSLDKALNVANRSEQSSLQHVYKISLVSGIPMYGYHAAEEQFLKIYLYNPISVRKVADLLLGGAVMNKPFQPHESHIPYPLQLFIDYNLYGMNLINVAALKFRKSAKDVNVKEGDESSVEENKESNIPSQVSSLNRSSASQVWNEENIPGDMWLPSNVERQSTCELEVDVVAADITNRLEIASTVGTNPGLAALWEDEKQRRRDAGESSQIIPDCSQERVVESSDSEKDLLKRFLEIVQLQQTFRDTQSDDSIVSHPSLPASQVERHLSTEDSSASSQNTVVLETHDSDEENDRREHPPIINIDSIKKVVSASQSFSSKGSQGSEGRDKTVAEILASLLEEGGPPPTQVSALEEQDSILSQSLLLDEDEARLEEEETVVMSQSLVCEGRDERAGIKDGDCSLSNESEEVGSEGIDDDVIMSTDEESDCGDVIPQFDGASDKLPGCQKKAKRISATTGSNELTSSLGTGVERGNQSGPGSYTNMLQGGGVSSSMTWGSTGAGQGAQSFPVGAGVWNQQAWAQHHGQEAAWHEQNSQWSQQLHQYPNWSQPHQQQQQGSASSQYSPQQMSFRSSPSSMSAAGRSFHSHQNPYQSPTQPQQFHSPSSSSSPHSFQFSQSPYQSPSRSQHVADPYHSPSQPAYQSPRQNQHYQSHNQAYHSPPANSPYQSPPSTLPYQSPSSNPPYQSPSGQLYPSPYQSPSHHSSYQGSPRQTFPHSYQSPTHSAGRYPVSQVLPHAGWGSQGAAGYTGYYHSQVSSQPAQTSDSNQQSANSPHLPQNSQSALPYSQSSSHSNASVGSCTQVGTSNSQVTCSTQAGFTHTETTAAIQNCHVTDVQLTKSNYQQITRVQSQSVNSHFTQEKGGDAHAIQMCDQFSHGTGKSISQEDSRPSSGFKSPQLPHGSPLHSSMSMDVPKVSHEGTHASSQTFMRSTPSMMSSSAPMLPKQEFTFAESRAQMEGSKSLICNEASLSTNRKSHSQTFEVPHSTKISTLNFKPKTNAAPSIGKGSVLTSSVTLDSPSAIRANDVEGKVKEERKPEITSATPMIQQLLSEESPAKMNISPEEREAALKKPMLSPNVPITKKKKSKAGQGTKGRPRSTSMSFPLATTPGFGGYSPQSVMNPHMLARPGRSHSISLPFSSDHALPGPIPENSLQQLEPWKQQQNLNMASHQWQQHRQLQQQQQQQQQWGGNHWSDCGEGGSSSGPTSSGAQDMHSSRLQQRAFSTESADSPSCHNNFLQSEMILCSGSQDISLKNLADGTQAPLSDMNKGSDGGVDDNAKSLSSLFQLVSDVGSGAEESLWDNSASTVVPNIFADSGNDLETSKSTPTSDINQESPSIKDFITLETPFKHTSEKVNLDVTGLTSSEDSDRMDTDVYIPTDMLPLKGKKSHSDHPRLGKHNRMKKMGLALRKVVLYPHGCSSNPSYTYTFHVPSQVYKKLNFFKTLEARKHCVKVVRLHPMDARRYSLLKIGREMVKVVKLTESDLAKYNVSLPPPSRNADGSCNRVNLDIPTVSSDRTGNDSSSDERPLSNFDTDFPPNKVAPPSSFHAGQVSASFSRSSSSSVPQNSVSTFADWSSRQYAGQRSTSYSDSPQTQQAASSYPYQHQSGDGGFGTFPAHQQVAQPGTFRNSQFPSEQDSGTNLRFQQLSHKSDDFHSQPSSSSSTVSSSTMPLLSSTGSYSPIQQGTYTNHSYYDQQQQQQYYHQQQYLHIQQYQLLQQQQQQYIQQQQSEASNKPSQTNSKNGLRSLGQHGPTSTIDSGNVSGDNGNEAQLQHSGDDLAHVQITGTFPVNTRVNALRKNHAESQTKTKLMMAHVKPTETDTSVMGARLKPSQTSITESHLKVSLADMAVTDAHPNPSLISSSAMDQLDTDVSMTASHPELSEADNTATLARLNPLETNTSVTTTHLKLRVSSRESPCSSHPIWSVDNGYDGTNILSNECSSAVSNAVTHKKSRRRRKRSRLSLKRSRPVPAESHNSDHDKLKTDRTVAVSCSNDSPQSVGTRISCSASDDNLFCSPSADAFSHLKQGVVVMERKLRSKNVKSLQLCEDLQHSGGSVGSTLTSNRIASSGSQREASEEGGSSGDLYPSRGVCLRRGNSVMSRSVKQAKVPSRNQKPQRRHRQNPRREGVHYIVVGKFRGHQAMLVKVEKLDLNISDVVSAALYEERANKDIKRIARKLEIKPDAPHDKECDVVNVRQDRNVLKRSLKKKKRRWRTPRKVERSTTGLSYAGSTEVLPEAKDSSIVLDTEYTAKSEQEINREASSALEGNTGGQSKNVQAGPFHRKGASENKYIPFPSDAFFFKLKESFDKRHKEKEKLDDLTNRVSIDQFFPSMEIPSILNFQRKFETNLRKVEQDDYSSSSDDEDDFLEDFILKGKISEIETENGWFSCMPRSIAASSSAQFFGNKTFLEEKKNETNHPVNNFCSSLNHNLVEQMTTPNENLFGRANTNIHHLTKDLIEYSNSPTLLSGPIMSKKMELEDEGEPSGLNVKNVSTNSGDKEEEKEDYLKSQMVFFEDISSDSDSNTTIIVDNYTEKEHVSSRVSPSFPPFPMYSTCKLDQVSTYTDITNVPPISSPFESEPSSVMRKGCNYSQSVLTMFGSRDLATMRTATVFSDSGSCKDIPHLGMRMMHSENCEAPSIDYHPTSDALSETGITLLDFPQEEDTDIQKPEDGEEELNRCSNSGDAQDEDKVQTSDSRDAQDEDKVQTSDSRDAQDEDKVQISDSRDAQDEDKVQTSDSRDAHDQDDALTGIQEYSIEATDKLSDDEVLSRNNTDSEVSISIRKCISSLPKKNEKPEKIRSVRKLCRLRQRKKVDLQAVEDHSSSNEEGSPVSPPHSHMVHNKRLRQRKQVKYTFCSEEIGSSGEEFPNNDPSDSTISGIHRTTGLSVARPHNLSKRKVPISQNENLPEKRTNSVVENADVGQATRGRFRARSSRGKKKKSMGGDKLLNSLSLLHMATLANLTESQSESVDAQSPSEQGPPDLQLSQYGDRIAEDHSVSYNSSLQNMSFISPQTSEELESSPPLAFSPTQKKVKSVECTRQRGGAHLASRRLLNFSSHPRHSLRPGCNGASNLGSKPIPFSRLMPSSDPSSPVPSNFSFGHNANNSPVQLENLIHGEEADVGTSTLQLLETKRAQVNCASFSMKDILRLTTHDDSMDSDSKDGVTVVKPPEAKRAQIKSKNISMNDILQLTNVENIENDEEETLSASHSLLSQLATFSGAQCQVPLSCSAPIVAVTSTQPFMSTSTSLSESAASADTSPKPLFHAMENTTNGATSISPVTHSSVEVLVENTPRSSQTVKDDLGKNLSVGGVSDDSRASGLERSLSATIAQHCEETLEDKSADKKSIIESDPLCLSVNTDEESILESQPSVSSTLQVVTTTDRSDDILVAQQTSTSTAVDTLTSTDSHVVPVSTSVLSKSEPVALGIRKYDLTDEENHRNNTTPENIDADAQQSAEVPRIYITHPDTPEENTEIGLHCTAITSSDSTTAELRNNTHQSQNCVKTKPKELNPLNPLQIPPSYPYPGHTFPTASPSTQSFSGSSGSSYYSSYPFCWQWPVPNSGADAMTSPLNLCTNKKSPITYSPITPTSPDSPHEVMNIPQVNIPKLSPPLKKSKPLWYPWLSVEKVNSEKKIKARDSVNDLRKTLPARPDIPSHYTGVFNSTSEPKWQEGNKAPLPPSKNKSTPHKVDSQSNCLAKSGPLKINKDALSSCKTVSQFLGTVIESAYEQENISYIPKCGSKRPSAPKEKALSFKQSGIRYSNSSLPAEQVRMGSATDQSRQDNRTLWNGHHISLPTAQLEEHGLTVASEVNCDERPGQGSNSCSSTQNLHYPYDHLNGQNLPLSRTRNGESDRVRTLLENEKILRSQLGLSQSPQVCTSSMTPGQKERLSLTDRLVTQLIKGDGQEYGSNAAPPMDASRGRKPKSNAKKDSKSQSGSPAGSQSSTNQADDSDLRKREHDKGNSDGENNGNTMNSDTKSVDRDLTLCPVNFPPSRMSVAESVQELGLHSVQIPQVYCSIKEDLPDKPMEHGGRVLKVDSRRLCELQPFESTWQPSVIAAWQSQSVSASRILASQPEGRPLWSRLQQEPQLRFLLSNDRLITVSPCHAPPSRKNVVKWLQLKMAGLRSGAEKHSGKYSEEKRSCAFSEKPQEVPLLSDLHQDTEVTDILDVTHSSDLEDCSTLVDTDMDVSSSQITTPVQLRSSLRPGSAETSRRKRLLRFSVEGQADKASDSLSSPETLDEHFKKTKRRTDAEKIPRKPKGSSTSTPVRPSSHNVPDPICTPIIPTRGEGDNIEKMPGTGQHTPMRRISTNTENMLRKDVLASQTQRQFSVLGFSANEMSQIEGPTPENTYNFKVAKDHLQGAKALHKYQYMTTLSLELHIETRGSLRPDPEFDAIQVLFYSVHEDIPEDEGKRSVTGAIIVDLNSWHIVTDRTKREKDNALTSSDTSSKSKQKSGVSSMTGDHTVGAAASSSTDASQSFAHSPKPTASRAPTPPPSSGKGKRKSKQRYSQSPTPSPAAGVVSKDTMLDKCGMEDMEVTYVQNELDLIKTFTELVQRFDPDILVGFEIQMLSWGYLMHRAAHLGLELCSSIARVPDAKGDNRFSAEKDEWGADYMSEIHVAGRIVLNLWRILKHEVTLNAYTFENVAFHVLHRRIPLFSFRSLCNWYKHKLLRWRVFEHYTRRVKGQLEIIEQLDIIGKTSEFARVFGIEFYDVLARGTQIRVESMMLRLAKPMNYVPVSPSVNQRARQKAPECIPLTLEPESQYYTSPVVVLDFQSLYPSIMIAYNYCFSTCLGRLDHLESAHEGPIEFGCTSLKVQPATLKKIRDLVTVSPNGVVFLKPAVKKGILPKMVEEILNTRLMVKKSMKSYKDDKTLMRMLDARQLGLKLIANVTYGYTGASFSGRMPCIEVGDSIVRKARESLERAIKLVEETPGWGAKVVYGDTDSLFIHFPGRSKDEAFVVGQEIADAVTAMFPSPMKLKFEKVYLPCVLQTKKRYVGFMYETPNQKEPVFDAKGIETVRRDSCSAVAKILERSIKILFSSHDLSRVRIYVTRQLLKLLQGKVSILDLIFAKEFRGSMGYKPGACVPALEIARKRLRLDRRSEPRVGERVPYVIVHGSPGLPLIQLVREPQELASDASLRLNAVYYITKQILPPLDRLFSLIGVNVFKWYQEMPKIVRVGPMMGAASSVKQGTISHFFSTTNCPVCEAQTKSPVCAQCQGDPQLVVLTINSKLREWERTYSRLAQVCAVCQGMWDKEQSCVSMDCPFVFRRIIAKQDLIRADNLKDVLNKFLQF